MGNSDIRSMAHIEEVDKREIQGLNLAVDASNWLYKYMTTTARFTRTEAYTNDNGAELSNLIGVPRGIRKFFRNNINPIFVFDGKPHTLKMEEINRRKQKRKVASDKRDDADDSTEKSKYESRSQQLNDDVIETTKKVLDILDVNYMTAPQAAESQAAYMTHYEDIDAMISDDYDSLVFGSELTIRKFTTSEDTVELMSLKNSLEEYGIDRKGLILATILCGTDYNDGVKGIGPKTALKKVKDINSVSELRENVDSDVDRAEEIYHLYLNPTVSDEWRKPQISRPKTQKLREYLKDQSIDIGEVDKAIKDIDKASSQTGLNNF